MFFIFSTAIRFSDRNCGKKVFFQFSITKVTLILSSNLFEEAETGEEAVSRAHFVPECSRRKVETSVREELFDVIGGVPASVRSGAESEVFIFVLALRREILLPVSEPEDVIGTSGLLISKYYIVRLPLNVSYVNTIWRLSVSCD